MAANAIPTPELKVNTAKGADESCAPVTLKQRFEKLLREVFEVDSAFHAIRNFRNEWGDIKTALHYWLEIGNLFGRSGMLQVIKRTAVGYGRYQGAKLQRGD